KQGKGDTVQVQLVDAAGRADGEVFRADFEGDQCEHKSTFSEPALWCMEFPNLYQAHISLLHDGKNVHEIRQKFGFRTVEVKERDGVYVNGVKIKFKGVNRHSFTPESGRTTSKAVSIHDINLIKEMNMNAVRMAHDPPDNHFLEVCDS